MYKKILVAYDGSEGAKNALEHGIELANILEAKITAVWVRGSLPHFPETVDEVSQETEAADKYFKKLRQDVKNSERNHGIEISCEALKGHPAKAILNFAEAKAFDLIVLGSRGHSELWGRVIGHTADKVSEHAHCDVLIIKTKEQT